MRSPFVRLVLFFVILAAAVYGLTRLVPGLQGLLGLDMGASGAAQQLEEAFRQAPEGVGGTRPAWLTVLLALVGSLVFAFPVVWTYAVTKQREGYEQSVIQMIIMLPVAVAAVVLVVFDSVALAFALAGIVAAVRFRTTLKDVNDAVFAFVAIGIGLAAGVQSWLLAGALSFVFSLLALTLWKLDLVAGGAAARGASLASALTGGGQAVSAGDRGPWTTLNRASVERVRPFGEQLALHLRADALGTERPYQFAVVVHTDRPEAAAPVVGQTLDEAAKRTHLVCTIPDGGGSAALVYLVRLKKKTEVGALLRDVLALEPVRGVEIGRVSPSTYS